MPYIILGLTLLIAVVLLVRWFLTADPKSVLLALKWLAALIGLGLVLFALWGGAKQLLFFAAAFLFPFLSRAWRFWQRYRAATGPAPGQSSNVKTRFLHMTLDHDSGAMEGTVLEGPFRGSRLTELQEDQLLALWRDCRTQDAQSAAVLEAYLDRNHGPAWREAAGAGTGGYEEAHYEAGHDAGQEGANDNRGFQGGGPGGFGGSGGSGRGGGRPDGPMGRDEACEILGVNPNATAEEIRRAHRRLMQQVHPDHGGSNYLAAKINQAKDLLLKGKA
ncbi:DnaJ domain-containing protein [Rhodovibrionaceae bacterium A322]